MEEPNNYKNFDEKYRDSIKYSVGNGSYFKDGFNWYCTLFLRSIVDRTFFVFMSIMGIIIIYNVVSLIFMLLPLKEDIYISIKEKDMSKYQTKIYDLSKNKEAESTDEDILRYLLISYVEEREAHNYKRANINDINKKLEKVRNVSSSDVFNEFNFFMSRENQNGPFYYFGRDAEITVQVNSFKFIRIHREKFIDKVKDFFDIGLMPIKAEVYYTLRTQIGDAITSQKRKAVISFKFSGVEYNDKTNQYSPVKLLVTSYKNYELK